MKLKKVMSVLLASAVMLGALTGCGGDKKEAAKSDTIKVGVFLPLTGDNAAGGELELRGVKLANKLHPEVLGKKVELVVADNKSDKAEAASVAARLIEKDKVVTVIGTYGSSLAMAAGNIVKEAKVPAIGTSCTNPQVTANNDYYFRACFIDPFQGQVMATFASNTLKVKNVAILLDSSSDYSKGLAQVFQETLEKAGGKIVTKEAFLSKDLDFKASLTKIKATNPEAVYVPGYYEEVSKIIKQAREIGLDVPMMGCDGWESPKLAEIAGKDALNNCYYVSAFSAQDTDPSVQAFIKAYKEKYQKDPDIFAMQGYNAGLVVVDSIKRAGSTDGTAIAKAMEATKDLPVASGKLTYDANHNPIISALIISLDGGVPSLKEKISL